MPIANKPYPIPPFDRLAPTTEDLDCLDLFYDSKGRAQLVERVKHALEVDDLGFQSVTNSSHRGKEIKPHRSKEWWLS